MHNNITQTQREQQNNNLQRNNNIKSTNCDETKEIHPTDERFRSGGSYWVRGLSQRCAIIAQTLARFMTSHLDYRIISM